MIISRQYQFIFIAVGKTATTSIEWALQDFNEVKLPKHTHLYNLSRLAQLNHEPYFKFCFTRNPWDRMVSIYFQLRRAKYLSGSVNKLLTAWAKQYDFKAFLKTLSRRMPEQLQKRTVVSYIRDKSGQRQVDFMGRFENLQADFNQVCRHLSLPGIRLPKMNAEKREHYSFYYDEESKNIVRRYFNRDIEQGRYLFEVIEKQNVCV